MKGYCGHITHLSVAQTLRFWYSVCLFFFLFVCTSCCADFAKEKWSNVSEEKLHFVFCAQIGLKTALKSSFSISASPGFPKIFLMVRPVTCKFTPKDFYRTRVYEHKGWSRFRCWSLGEILKLEFVQHFAADVL